MIGSVVGNYRIVEKLGDGGMGAVYRAVDELLDREVAVKVLRSELAGQAALIERFRAEAIALARLNHPRIATLHGLERNGANFVMIMEYVRGETLEQVVARSGGLSWTRAVDICVDICDALDHAHDKGVVHRDIKPANVMLSTAGLIKVMDFGIARVVGRDRQTQFGHAVGTPMYMAPEQLRGEEVDGRADLYALGAVLFELLTGRVAFEAESDYALMMKQLNEPPTAPSAFVRDVPAAVDALVLKAMAKSRDDRPVNAAAMRAALRDTLQGAQQRGVSPGVGATRVAEPSWGNAPAAPVGLASRDELPATRIAASQPAQSVDGIPATRFAGSAAIAPARREGRPWLVGVAVCIAVGAGAATYRSVTREVEYGGVYPAQKEAGGSRPTDTLRVSTPVTGPATDAPTREPVRLPVVGSLQEVGGGTSTPKTPPSGSGGQTVVTPVAPRRAERPTEPPKSEAPKGDSPKGAAPGDVGAMPPAASPPTESAKAESGFRNAVAKQVEVFAQAIRDRDVDTVEQLLSASGTNRSVHNQLVALLQAGRVEVSDVNVTNRSRDDESGAAQFGATLNFRSPFGANRKTDTQFSIALVRASGGWSLASAQVIGSPKFR